MKKMILTYLLTLAALPAQAQDLHHCYETAPASAPKGTQMQQATAMSMAFGYHESAILYRRACGINTTPDKDYIEQTLAEAGCAIDSDFGKKQMLVLDAPLMEASGGLFDSGTMQRNPEVRAAICSKVSAFPPLTGMDRAGYRQMLTTINEMNTALRANASKLK